MVPRKLCHVVEVMEVVSNHENREAMPRHQNRETVKSYHLTETMKSSTHGNGVPRSWVTLDAELVKHSRSVHSLYPV